MDDENAKLRIANLEAEVEQLRELHQADLRQLIDSMPLTEHNRVMMECLAAARAEVEAVKADLECARAELAGWTGARVHFDALKEQRADLQRQLAAAREAIEKAPHHFKCSDEWEGGNGCDCWKSTALAQIEAGGGK